ncbi:MAG TPA: hypothetical protein VEW74_00525 [Candidatus Nitrosotalea sp.]|nr:hypothetical protein [Candidatus Nitrosotalea sp.]
MTSLAFVIALAQPALHLSVQPWTGSDFQTTSSGAAKYRLEIAGKPNGSIHLQAQNVARGWLAAFCTPKLCSPGRIEMQLPKSGTAVVQFELIREADDAPKQSGAKITNADGVSVSVPAAYRQ